MRLCNCSDLTEVQIAQGDHYDDCPIHVASGAAVLVPPERGTQLQSLEEVESTRVEEEDYDASN